MNTFDELHSRSLTWGRAITPLSRPIVVAPPAQAAARRARRKAGVDWYVLGVALLMITSAAAAVVRLLGAA